MSQRVRPADLPVLAQLALPEVRRAQPGKANLRRILPCEADRAALCAAVRRIALVIMETRAKRYRLGYSVPETDVRIVAVESLARRRS